MNDLQELKKGNILGEDEKGKSKLQMRNQTFSAYSSPTHDFSFKVTFQQNKCSPCISTVDLSPADEIFFHGQLLPLRLLSHIPRSPHFSAHSLEIDTFTIPIQEENGKRTSITNANFQRKERVKSKSFSFFGKRRKLSFKMSHVIKRFIRVLRPLLGIKSKREKVELGRKPHSFSDRYFYPKKKREARERGGVVSAPVSRWTSPRNSGKLAANKSFSSTKSDSGMEELQDAIQAAIAHCKNSIGMDEKSQS